MNKKYLLIFLISVLFLVSLTTVCAGDNTTDTLQITDDNPELNIEETTSDKLKTAENNEVLTATNEPEKLETSYYYSSEDDQVYYDDTFITKNVKKYYNDGKKFKVKLVDSNGNPQEGVKVYFGKDTAKKPKVKYTNSKGIVTFSINYAVGKYKVISVAETTNKNDLNWAENTVTVKSTIPTKTLKKSIKQKTKKFQIKFLNKKGKALKNKKIKIKVKNKTYKIKTNSKGIAKIKINNLKVGKHKIKAINTATKETRKITVKITA